MGNLQNSAASVSPSRSEPSEFDPDSLSPAWQAGLLLAARHVAEPLGLEAPSAGSILQATGAGRTRAYEMRGRVLDTLADRQRPPGRPPAEPAPPLEADTRAELSGHMLRYLRSHPGACSAGPVRQHYSDDLRRFVLDLRRRYASVPLPDFALAIQIPTDTLTDWLRLPASEALQDPSAESPNDPPVADPTLPRIETVLDAWKCWDGTFSDFCHHVRYHLRIPWGSAILGAILRDNGLRTPQRRRGRSPDEKALRQQFETFFPGAQWIGDGSPVTVHLDGQSFTFNLELMTDASSGAFAGFDVRDHEDSQAVTSAFDDGVQTTGSPPLALLLDNRPSNFAPEVYDTLGSTLLIPATPARPQNKAPTEGAFGLFAQQAPPLVIQNHLDQPREIAREILTLVFRTWARTLNHKPRSDRNGRSRIQLYHDANPTPEEIAQARAALQQRLRKQQRANETRRRRADPHVRPLLDEAFRRLDLDDPTGNLRDAIAAYPLDAVLEAISIFEGKLHADTLPPNADARYLLGIARNLAQQHEDLEIAHALWNKRLRARDAILQHLNAQRQHLQNACPNLNPFALLTTFLDQALNSERHLDRSFWLQAAASTINAHPSSTTKALFHSAARHISATFRLPHPERLAAIRFLAAKLLPIHLFHDLA